ncbi:kinase-like domain-containing protein [Syncephalis pseudoplumigaleata]|uniref:Kinase-like domain-containing protein n=1 Tax=Syncephalis pseudoplumigaleata TaxID=1712513 RepID=A0A4P9YUI6_9FUNG|nr:kinase-like domain-containing protein [Syncephalis pseudoplumigaleata]|eukprot:RKP23418.1 kinase-like domain-containing protein [Syncephalis pseudoplumigaleata]
MDHAGETVKYYARRLSTKEKAIQLPKLFYQVLKGVYFLHSAGVFHGDIKPANIMISTDENNKPKATLIDFDGSILFKPGTELVRRHWDFTFEYMAPELSRPEKPHWLLKSDVWTVGASLYHVLSGKKPLKAYFRTKVRKHASAFHTVIRILYTIKALHFPPVAEEREARTLQPAIAMMEKLMIVSSRERPDIFKFFEWYPTLGAAIAQVPPRKMTTS